MNILLVVAISWLICGVLSIALGRQKVTGNDLIGRIMAYTCVVLGGAISLILKGEFVADVEYLDDEEE